MRTEICSNCGEEWPIYDMEALVCGKSTQYLCRVCMARGRYRVDQRVIGRFQEHKKKKQKDQKR